MRIAVTGYSGSGKTAFLTSLIAQLRQHDISRFRLSDPDALITACPRAQAGDNGGLWGDFPYDQYFASIANHSSWPYKTADCAKYTLDLGASTWLLHQARLTLFDLPGERFADAAMVHMDYAQWSSHQLNWLGVITQVHNGRWTILRGNSNLQHVQDYLELLKDGSGESVAEAEVIGAYKRALAEMVRNYHVYASPSLFLLDRNGKTAADVFRKLTGADHCAAITDVAQCRFAGMPGQEFAPLPQRFWSDCPDLAKCFESRYDAYRHQIVLPIFRQLAECDGMVMLIDLADILASGPPQLHDVDQFLSQLLDALRPGGNVFQAVLNRFGLARRIRRIAVAASQCDRFHPDDTDKLRFLVEKLAEPYLARIPGARRGYFACAAVRSTSYTDDGRLRGRVYCGNGTKVAGDEETYDVDRIPDAWDHMDGWPAEWDSQEFCHIPFVWPKMPRVFRAVPNHIALDDIFRFVTGW
jgi:predicted YcjX-like family ATPase